MPYVLLLALFSRVIFFFLFFSVPAWNIHMSFRFDERALAILNGQPIANLAAWGSYPLLLSGIYKILDVLHLLEYRSAILFWLYQVVGIITAGVCLRILKTLQVSKVVSEITVAFLLILNPLQIYINSMNISESLFQLTSVLALALYLKCFRLQDWLRWVFFFICLALSILERNIIIPFLLLLPIYQLFFTGKERKILWSPKIILGALVAGLILWGAGRMNARHDLRQDSSLNSNRGANIAQTWCEAPIINFKTLDNSFWFSPPAFWPLEKTRSIYLDKDFNDTSFYTQLAFGCVAKDPSLVVLRLRSILNVFNGVLYPDPLDGQLKTLHQVYGAVYLAAFFFLLLAAGILIRNSAAQVLGLFILSCLAAVYLANTGEARFVYSFLPVLAVAVALLWHLLPAPKKYFYLIAAGVLGGMSSLIPPLHVLMFQRDQARFMALDNFARKELVHTRLNELPTLPEVGVCKETVPKSDAQVAAAFEQFRQMQSKPMTERQLYCRNLLMVKMTYLKNIPIPLTLIQKPSALPGGLHKLNHPIEAIAGQLLHAELLKSLKQESLMADGETYEDLLFLLLRYQHRFDLNRPEYKGAVTESLLKPDPSIEAALIYRDALTQVLKAP